MKAESSAYIRSARTEYRSALLYSKSRISTTKAPIPGKPTAADMRYELQDPSVAAASSSSSASASAGKGPERSNSTTYPPRSADFGRGEQDAVQTKTNEVTDALRRTLGTMQVELEKSVMSVQMLGASVAPLTQLPSAS